MVRPSVDPQTRLDSLFINATNVCPQHPFGGVALVGAATIEYLRTGKMQSEQILGHTLEGSRKRDLVAVTAAIHRLFGASRPTGNMLNNSVPFAHDLVANGIVSTAVEFDRGNQGIILPTIDIPDPEQRERFTALAAPGSKRLGKLGLALSAASNVLLMPDSPAQPFFDEYQGAILEIAKCYEDAPEDPRRMQELVEARTALSDQLRVPLFLNMSPDLDADTKNVAVGNLLRHTPSEALVHKHFGQPQA